MCCLLSPRPLPSLTPRLTAALRDHADRKVWRGGKSRPQKYANMVTAHLICMLRVGHVVYGDFIKCNHIFVENDQVTSPFFIRMTLTYTAVQKVEVGKIF